MKQNIVILCCILFTLGMCSSPEVPEILLHIEGTVTFANTGEPIEGANIQLYEIFEGPFLTSTSTDLEGRYVLLYNTKCTKCVYSVVLGTGGEGKAKRIEVTSQIQIIDFQL